VAIYQRKETGVWYADYYADGKRVQESTGTRNKREAEKFMALRVLRGAARRVRETRACGAAGTVGALYRLRQDAQTFLETGRANVRKSFELSGIGETGGDQPVEG
jgi:hypothetical protein